MDIEEFEKKNKDSRKISIKEFVRRCANRDRLDDLLGMEIATGITLFDLWNGELNDTSVSPKVMSTIKELMGDKMDSQSEVIPYFREMINRGNSVVEGVISKLKGTLGELRFKEVFGTGARLAESGSQKGWDLFAPKAGYIQVKIHKESNTVMDAIKENAERLKNGEILDSGKTIKQINYAMSSNIYDELKEKGVEETYGVRLYKVPITAEEAGEIVRDEINETAWAECFKDIFGVVFIALALHSAINIFLTVVSKKSRKKAIADTIKSTAFTLTAFAVVRFVENLSEVVASTSSIPIPEPVSKLVAITTLVTTRGTLKKIEKRWDWVDFMTKDNERLKNLISSLSVKDRKKKKGTLLHSGLVAC